MNNKNMKFNEYKFSSNQNKKGRLTPNFNNDNDSKGQRLKLNFN